MSISTNIRLYRKRAGLTQIDLAKDLEVSIATLRRWEAGETAPTGTRITELAERLGVDPTAIVADSDTKAKSTVTSQNGTLVFENGGTRVELPPTAEGYELFNKIVDNFLEKNSK
ncbi:MAG: helix-turn-helix transcriptional regulator [Synergistaceae bacterium]|nr:helix-turn-helix transcriptional regulator [Synergistaceae bacterium]